MSPFKKPFQPSNEPTATPRDTDPLLPDDPTTETPASPGSTKVDISQYEQGTGR